MHLLHTAKDSLVGAASLLNNYLITSLWILKSVRLHVNAFNSIISSVFSSVHWKCIWNASMPWIGNQFLVIGQHLLPLGLCVSVHNHENENQCEKKNGRKKQMYIDAFINCLYNFSVSIHAIFQETLCAQWVFVSIMCACVEKSANVAFAFFSIAFLSLFLCIAIIQ